VSRRSVVLALPLRQGAGASTAATFDAAGNILTFPHELSGHEGQTRAYNDANEWIGYLDGEGHATGGGNFAYDVMGNPTTWKGAALTFDRNNGLASYTTGQTQQLTAGYRADGLRAWKESDGATAYYLYDGDMLLAEMDAAGTVTTYNTWGPTGLLNRTNLQTNREVWYLFDPQGNVAQRTDAAGHVLSADQYDAWGNLLAGGDEQDPYGYNGQFGYYTDHETGMILCTHRYYDPHAGRWLTQDPIGYEGGLNLYKYCGNDPTNRIDPNGLDDDDWISSNLSLSSYGSIGAETPFTNAATNSFQDKISNLGMIPGFGDVLDVGNAIGYAARHKWWDAGLSAVAVIPLVGSGVAKILKNKAVRNGVVYVIKDGKKIIYVGSTLAIARRTTEHYRKYGSSILNVIPIATNLSWTQMHGLEQLMYDYFSQAGHALRTYRGTLPNNLVHLLNPLRKTFFQAAERYLWRTKSLLELVNEAIR